MVPTKPYTNHITRSILLINYQRKKVLKITRFPKVKICEKNPTVNR